MKPTVHDIASRAGVSLATVDRVLNRRPGVSARTREKVDQAVSELGFVRDVAAANLAKGRVYPLTFIIPSNDNSFMRGLRLALNEASARAGVERIAIRLVDVPAFDAAALAAALRQAAMEEPAGIAFVAVDAPEVAAAAAEISESGIPLVTLVSDLSGAERDHYAGIDNTAAGRTAASLLGRFAGGRSGTVAVLAGSMLVRDHRERCDAFAAVMAADFPTLALQPVLEGRDDPDVVEQLVADLFASRSDIVALYSLGAGNRGLVRALDRLSPERRPVVIAHELTETTRGALQAGLIDAVLNQDAGHEVRSAIRVLKAKADGLPVVAAQERIRIDIFLKDNLP
ncbi:MAG: LacI family DNA-binding transcriptional regulator [Alphaproteobacteria bacterium]|nr:LacI family DNA-binding transcriptional regulator [Alphaproteobacteria bacterium]MBU0834006.1 LacI family DNA-binding transcriptional regulator [Alphaproteobacteria bacterium]MBU1763996.1 LacI family DNA-binding transcriptional regulator [Alphaproteobacteria bacterium]